MRLSEHRQKGKTTLLKHFHFHFSMAKILKMRILFVLRSDNLSYFPLDSRTRISKKITFFAAVGNGFTPATLRANTGKASACHTEGGKKEGRKGDIISELAEGGWEYMDPEEGGGEGLIHFNSTCIFSDSE